LKEKPTRSREIDVNISLIICTRNRCQQLARCLDSVACITFEGQWELIVVDNGSVDETASVIREFVNTSVVPVVHLFEPTRGKSNALNAALRIARGEILTFTDDDCYPAGDFLTEVWCGFKDPSLGYMTGRIMLHDPTDDPTTTKESTSPITFPGRSLRHLWEVVGANMAFRREVLNEIGGFDPLFGPGSLFNAVAEDMDVAIRANAAGWKGQYRPEVIVRHHHGRKASDVAELTRMWRGYAIGKGAVHAKLLLRGHEVCWFAWICYHYLRNGQWYESGFFWEAVGGTKYAYIYLTQTFRSQLRLRAVGLPRHGL
jgi:cellulose synthase/poly-beta-1,6-N-acetylglucosamine synthase-like glycosyltransferase